MIVKSPRAPTKPNAVAIAASGAILAPMIDERQRASLVTLLAWYREMGVEEVVDSLPIDWLERDSAIPGEDASARLRASLPDASSAGAAPAPAATARPAVHDARPQTRQTMAAPSASPVARGDAPAQAYRSTASEIPQLADVSSLSDLQDQLARFEGCSLRNTAKNLCFYRGNPKARLMIIGEAPGRDEDIQGKPFVGRAGQLLDRMLGAIGLAEADVHITNVVYWRPPGNRTPTPQEVQACRPFLERQVALVEPELVLLLGGSAAKHVLDTADGIMRLRGHWRDVELGGRRLRALATLHPAYLLRTPAAKRMAWLDLRSLATALQHTT